MDAVAGSTSICELATRCTNSFECIVSGAHLDTNGFDAVETQWGRFNIWASNVGVFAKQNASLDYRLRYSHDISSMFVKLLELLNRNLQRAIACQVQSTETKNGHDGPGLDYLLESFTVAIEATTAGIDRLQTLAIMIRKSSAQSRKTKATTLGGDEEGEHFESFAVTILRHRFREAPGSLCEQLAASIAMRRKRFLYNAKHQRKLTFNTSIGVKDTRPVSASHQAIQHITPSKRMPSSTSFSPDSMPTFKHSTGKHAPSQTNASTLNSQAFRNLLRNYKPPPTLASGGTSIRDPTFDYPPPPKVEKGQKECTCPYCCELLSTDKTKHNRWWKNHVDTDLEPYICISERCRSNPVELPRLEDWIQHMAGHGPPEKAWNVHNLVWKCPVCDGMELFLWKQEFVEHMNSCHSNRFTKSQLTALIRRSTTSIIREAFTCPLCNCIPEEIQQITPQNREKVQDLLPRHIAGHLKSAAFLSLPHRDDISDHLSEASHDPSRGDPDIRAEEETYSHDSDLADVPLTFDEDTPMTDNEDPSIMAIANEEQMEILWDFLPAHPYDRDSDPILRRFATAQEEKVVQSLDEGPSEARIKFPLFEVPRKPTVHFVGRQATLAQMQDISKERSALTIAGLKGVGKTEIILQLCDRLREEQRDEDVLWFNCNSIGSFRKSCLSIAAALDLQVQRGTDNDEDSLYVQLLQYIAQILSDNSRRDGLIVLDGLNTLTTFADLDQFLVAMIKIQQSGFAVLASTYDLVVAEALSPYGFSTLTMPSLEQEDSLLLLTKSLEKVNLEQKISIETLANIIDGIPSLIVSISNLINDNSTSLQSCVDSLTGPLTVSGAMMKMFRTVTDIFDSLWDSECPTLLSLCPMAFFYHEAIPWDITCMKANVDSTLIMRRLEQLSLVTADHKSRVVTIRPLIQRMVYCWMRYNDVEDNVFIDAVANLTNIFPPPEFDKRKLAQILFPHMKSVLQFEIRPSWMKAMIHDKLALFEFDMENFTQAEAHAKDALSIHKTTLSSSEETFLRNRMLQAKLLGKLGRFQAAVDAFTEIKTIWENVGRLGRRPALECAKELGLLHIRLENFPRAESILNNAKTSLEMIDGDSLPLILELEDGLAVLHLAQGDIVRAEPILASTLRTKGIILGKEHPSTMETRVNKSRCFRRALSSAKTPDKTQSLTTVPFSPGVVDYAVAGVEYNRILGIYEKIGCRNHSGALHCINNLACISWHKGDFVEAKKQFELSANGYEAKFGSHHPYTYIAKSNLAKTLNTLGNVTEAEKVYRQAFTDILDEHLSIPSCGKLKASIAYDLAGVLKAQEKLGSAAGFYQLAVRYLAGLTQTAAVKSSTALCNEELADVRAIIAEMSSNETGSTLTGLSLRDAVR
ncbi:hypothetical protein BDV26DRAFT_251788 [Aspergillus bertholletiae]|uniref:Uncharacterized protein n=1 Tax=Aspergillus bertholletiae TaxID=1226010 RepID=A0A5N7BNQ8_9EURO|nr:hypothetical protein BDV26DRAFT_251788 [Aspergillus bertholletiae]